MESTVKVVAGFIFGVLVAGILGWNMMPSMMLHENSSPYGTEETVEKIKEMATEKGWAIPSVQALHKSVLKNGGGKLKPVMLVNLCQANHAFSILQGDDNKKISVFMPCTISVYEKSDGKTYIGTMNAGLLGKMFGGIVAEVMAEVSSDQQSIIKFSNM